MSLYLAALDLIDKNALPLAKKNTVQIIMGDIFTILGALAFLMVIISGLRYITARGNPESITKAKNNIMYSLIGLAIVILASTIVNYIIGKAS